MGFGILLVPGIRWPLALLFGAGFLFTIFLLIKGWGPSPDPKGTADYLVTEPVRHDERDITFARARTVIPGTESYQEYYSMHPEKEEADAKRRSKGILGTHGSIDNGYPPNVSMMQAAFEIPPFLGTYAENDPVPNTRKHELSAESTTDLVKKYALHLGADMVGVCRINPAWIYSHRGEIFYDNWDDWGREIQPESLPPYAVVFLTEMSETHVRAAPHTPSVAESAGCYAKGAYLGTLLARWFAHMGYRGVAQHTRHYDLVLPPLAVDAGLGEVGRHGYLIAPKYGARVRIFAVLTDMPLVPDSPIYLGVDEFCKRCKKCAESCPSSSIPLEEKVIYNGAQKWKLDADSCFEFWGKIGTDCSVCMAVCPFSRPDTPLHKIVRYVLARSAPAARILPAIDNFIYGRKWHTKSVPSWLEYTSVKKHSEF